MKASTLLLIIVAIILGSFVIQEQFFATVPFCDRFTQVTVTEGQVSTIECTRNMVIGTSYTCSPTSEITSNTENYLPGTYLACRSPYRSPLTPD